MIVCTYMYVCIYVCMYDSSSALLEFLVLSCLELRPHLYNDQKVAAECGRIRDMASVSCGALLVWL